MSTSNPVGREARSYGGDPRWMDARRPGVDNKGRSFGRGEQILYWPLTKTIMTGEEAKDAWRKFLSEKGDEEGYVYASAARVAARYQVREAADPSVSPSIRKAGTALTLVVSELRTYLKGEGLPIRGLDERFQENLARSFRGNRAVWEAHLKRAVLETIADMEVEARQSAPPPE